MTLSLVVSLLISAPPPSTNQPFRGFEKPAKEERGTLGESQLSVGKVKIYCADVGRWMLVEINDPGLKGARGMWLRKKKGDAMPPCDANEADVTALEGAAQYGYLAGIKGGYAFVLSADGAAAFRGVRVYSLVNGALIYDGEFDARQPTSLVSENRTTLMRFHSEVHARCQPTGDEAVSCWKEIRADVAIPDDVKLTPPPCDAVLKSHPDMLGALVAVPVEIDLASASKRKFIDGAATCSAPE
ncbi:MAG: hypothetical protein JNG84_05230 [Archangium sp.]|nr:hypothetical protein [Archangium sp.]